MKKLIITLLAIGCPFIMFAQNFWTQKADLPAGARYRCAGFSIGTKGYFTMGDINNIPNNTDLWEYDPGTNAWTQKASFPGPARNNLGAVFSINGKAYVGCGSSWVPGTYTNYNDFWMYDPVLNSWTSKATFPGAARNGAVSFVIGECGYMVSGIDQSVNFLNDMWEYNSVTDTWTQKASVGSFGRSNAVCFAIGRMGYFGLGRNSSNTKLSDFWQYDQVNNIWTQKNNFPGGARTYMSGVSVGGYGYIGFGSSATTDNNLDFWMYNPDTDTWIQKSGLTLGRNQAAIFELGGKIYAGTGYSLAGRLNDFWEYTPEGFGIDDVSAENLIINYYSQSKRLFIMGGWINTVTIYNISGQKILSAGFKKQNSVSVQVGEIPPGIYIVEVVSDRHSVAKKILLNN
ncbi:MAG TPA: T9SS type A sorting domain-containing protein [Bacteroidales bacterium]|nr:T9SS type A sorting domain-containing protein [Bacteroidales bacterium]